MAARKRKNDGKEFEAVFGEYLEVAHGFSKVTRNELCRGAQADRPYDCDLHGVTHSTTFRQIGYAGLAAFALALATAVFPDKLGEVQRTAEAAVAKFAPSLVQYALMIFGGVAGLIWHLGDRATTRHVWVECKNRQTSIKRTDINKVQNSVDDVRANSKAKWKPNEVWFASTSAYDQDALNFARQHGIRCFQLTDDGVQEIPS